jgi:hypothetical protein
VVSKTDLRVIDGWGAGKVTVARFGTERAGLPRFCYYNVGFHCSSSFTLRSQKRHSLASICVNHIYNKLPVERIKSPP